MSEAITGDAGIADLKDGIEDCSTSPAGIDRVLLRLYLQRASHRPQIPLEGCAVPGLPDRRAGDQNGSSADASYYEQMLLRHVPSLLLTTHCGRMEPGDILASTRCDERGISTDMDVGRFPRGTVGPAIGIGDVEDKKQRCDQNTPASKDHGR